MEKGNFKKGILYWLVDYRTFLILMFISILSQILTKGLFFTAPNLLSIARQIPTPMILVIGFTLVIGGSGFDMSAASMTSMLCCVYASLSLILPFPAAILATFLTSVLCGMLNGLIIEGFGVMPFLVTIATGQLFNGVARLITKGNSIGGLGDKVKYLGSGMLFGVIPVSLVITLVIIGMAVFVMRMTIYGRRVEALGSNRESLIVSGIRVKSISISTYVLMGVCCAIGAILLTGRISLAYSYLGGDMQMEIISSVLIGGNAIRGGRINIAGSVFGCMVMAVMNNMFSFVEISAYWEVLVKSLVILTAIILEARSERFLEKY